MLALARELKTKCFFLNSFSCTTTLKKEINFLAKRAKFVSNSGPPFFSSKGSVLLRWLYFYFLADWKAELSVALKIVHLDKCAQLPVHIFVLEMNLAFIALPLIALEWWSGLASVDLFWWAVQSHSHCLIIRRFQVVGREQYRLCTTGQCKTCHGNTSGVMTGGLSQSISSKDTWSPPGEHERRKMPDSLSYCIIDGFAFDAVVTKAKVFAFKRRTKAFCGDSHKPTSVCPTSSPLMSDKVDVPCLKGERRLGI